MVGESFIKDTDSAFIFDYKGSHKARRNERLREVLGRLLEGADELVKHRQRQRELQAHAALAAQAISGDAGVGPLGSTVDLGATGGAIAPGGASSPSVTSPT